MPIPVKYYGEDGKEILAELPDTEPQEAELPAAKEPSSRDVLIGAVFAFASLVIICATVVLTAWIANR